MKAQPGIIILKKIKQEAKTESGLITNTHDSISQEPIAEIVQFNPEHGLGSHNIGLKKGVKVIYNKFGGIQTVNLDGNEYIIGDENIVQVILD